MLIPEVSAAADASGKFACSNGPPLLVNVREARRQLGGIGSTAFYAAVKRYSIQLVKLGGRSLVPMSEMERVVARLIAEKAPDCSEKTRALAASSVAARRTRSCNTSFTCSPPTPVSRHRKRGSSTALNEERPAVQGRAAANNCPHDQ
jgi:hypothetical protein